MVLTARAVYTEEPGGRLEHYPVASGTRIYDGALVAVFDSGADIARCGNWTDPSGTNHHFLGIARVTAETGVSVAGGESVVGDSAGTQLVTVDVSGVVLRGVTVTDSTATRVGAVVYASDENTFAVVATAGANPIGRIIRFITGTTCDIKLFSADQFRAYQGS